MTTSCRAVCLNRISMKLMMLALGQCLAAGIYSTAKAGPVEGMMAGVDLIANVMRADIRAMIVRDHGHKK